LKNEDMKLIHKSSHRKQNCTKAAKAG